MPRRVVSREAVLVAAARIFESEGAAGVSMRKVASAVGCSPMALYHYFATRDELIQALCDDGLRKLARRLSAIESRDRTPLDALNAGLLAYIHFAVSEPAAYRVAFLTALPPGAPSNSPSGEEAFGYLVRSVSRCVAHGLFLPGRSVAEISHILWAAIHGVASLLITFPWLTSMQETLSAGTVTAIVDGLRAPEPGRPPLLP